MLNQQTLEKLHGLRLHGMAEGFRAQSERNRPVNPFQPFARAFRRLYSVTSAHNRDGRILMGE